MASLLRPNSDCCRFASWACSPSLPFLRSLQVGLCSLECALELLTAHARGPAPDWLSFLAGLRPAHNDRADRPILRWQECPGKVKCSAALFLLAHRALPDADRLLLRPPRNLNAYQFEKNRPSAFNLASLGMFRRPSEENVS